MIFDLFVRPSVILKHLWRYTNFGSLEFRSRYDFIDKPQYAWGLLSGAKIAKSLGISKIIAIEFGVASGEGLKELISISKSIKKEYSIEVEIYGFDSGKGLPKPIDYRDIPYLWNEGEFESNKKNIENLIKNSQNTEVFFGNVKDTILKFKKKLNSNSPIGFISFDLDFYSSTKDAFNIFEFDDEYFLPRVPLYFDDICSSEHGYFNDHTGELLAIKEFNSSSDNSKHLHKKICPIHGFALRRVLRSAWIGGAYCFHNFLHSKYNDKITL